jgi:putative ATP-binding cassette transporter
VIIGLLIFVLPGFTQISVSTLTGFTIVMLYMMTPLQVVMNTVPTLGRGEVALRKVEEMGLTLAANINERATEARRDAQLHARGRGQQVHARPH